MQLSIFRSRRVAFIHIPYTLKHIHILTHMRARVLSTLIKTRTHIQQNEKKNGNQNAECEKSSFVWKKWNEILVVDSFISDCCSYVEFRNKCMSVSECKTSDV